MSHPYTNAQPHHYPYPNPQHPHPYPYPQPSCVSAAATGWLLPSARRGAVDAAADRSISARRVGPPATLLCPSD